MRLASFLTSMFIITVCLAVIIRTWFMYIKYERHMLKGEPRRRRSWYLRANVTQTVVLSVAIAVNFIILVND